VGVLSAGINGDMSKARVQIILVGVLSAEINGDMWKARVQIIFGCTVS
jgi:hypothetical protein